MSKIGLKQTVEGVKTSIIAGSLYGVLLIPLAYRTACQWVGGEEDA